MINPDDLQRVKLVQFAGGITYNSNGYAVLPAYTIIDILGSVQPLSNSEIRFLPEGTHYADFINILTDYPVDVDNTPTNLGDYFIWQDKVYKIFSSQDYRNFSSYSTNHISTTVARDNRLIYSNGTLNLPYPQIDDSFAPLYDLIKMAASCYNPAIPVLWGYQQELRPDLPFVVVNLEKTKNLYSTNYVENNATANTYKANKAIFLTVSYKFYAYDKVQAENLSETFRINFENYNLSTDRLAYAGFDNYDNEMTEELYENRTIFNVECRMNFNFILEQVSNAITTIDTVIASLSVQS